MKKRKAIIITAIVIVSIIVAGIAVTKIKAKKDSTNVLQENLGIPTKIIEITQSELLEEISYVGTIESNKSVTISPKITSELKELNFQEGDFIEKGNIIGTLEDSQFIAKLNSIQQKAETLETSTNYLSTEINNYNDENPIVKKIEALEENYNYLSNEVTNYKFLYENGAIPKNSYDKIIHERDMIAIQIKELNATSENNYNKLVHERDMAEMQLKELNAAANELNLNLQDTVITAPISGRIRAVNYNIGDLVMMGKPAFIIDDIENIIVKANIGELDLGKISIGTKAIIGISNSQEIFEGEVTKIMPSVNPVTKIGEVEISFIPKEKNNVMIGSSGQIRFIINSLPDQILIDNTSIKKLAEKEIVYVVDDNNVQEREIKTGLIVGNKTQVLKGLDVGERIAGKNINTLYDGAKIYVFQGVDN